MLGSAFSDVPRLNSYRTPAPLRCSLYTLFASLFSLSALTPMFGQALPQFNSTDVLNAASLCQPISPGSIVSIFGTNLAPTEAMALITPLPIELAGTSVSVDGSKAPIFSVSPTSIKLQIPWSLTFSYAG
jgi:hypothetical protein